jgi:hypothetical protein
MTDVAPSPEAHTFLTDPQDLRVHEVPAPPSEPPTSPQDSASAPPEQPDDPPPPQPATASPPTEDDPLPQQEPDPDDDKDSTRRLRDVTPTATGEISILNFEADFGDDRLPVFTESATIEAMDRLCIAPKTLVRPTNADFNAMQLPDDSAVRARVARLYEKRRNAHISEIIAERECVFAERRCGGSSADSGDSLAATQKMAEQTAIERIEWMQRREVEMLIVAELIREQTAQDDRDRDLRRSQQQREAMEQVRRRQEADKERRAVKRAVLMQRVQDREKELAEMQRRQNEQIERSQRQLAEQKAKRLREMADADIERQRRALSQREQLERLAEEEKKKIIVRHKEQAAHERAMIARRVEHLKEISERNQRTFEEHRARFTAAQQRTAQAVEERRKAMEQREAQAVERYDVLTKNRELTALALKTKNQMQVQRNQQAKSAIAHQKEERIRAIVFKDTKDQERRDAIEAKRVERYKHEREIEREKREHIEQENRSRLEEKRLRDEEYEKRLEEDQHRLVNVAKRREDDAAKRAAIQKVKDQFRNECAERKATQHRLERERKAREAREREGRAVQYVAGIKDLALKKRGQVTAMTFKKEDLLRQFRELLSRGGRVDIERLAKKFHIDLDFLRERIRQARRKPAVDV